MIRRRGGRSSRRRTGGWDASAMQHVRRTSRSPRPRCATGGIPGVSPKSPAQVLFYGSFSDDRAQLQVPRTGAVTETARKRGENGANLHQASAPRKSMLISVLRTHTSGLVPVACFLLVLVTCVCRHLSCRTGSATSAMCSHKGMFTTMSASMNQQASEANPVAPGASADANVGMDGVASPSSWYRVLGTKSPYPAPSDVNEGLLTDASYRADAHVPEGSELLHVALLARHGARYPNAGGIELLRTVRDRHQASAAATKLLNDVIAESESLPGELSEHGRKEMILLGKRFRARYDKVLPDWTWTNSTAYRLESTSKPRTADSAVAFAEGVEIDSKRLVQVSIKNEHAALNFHRFCKRYLQVSDAKSPKKTHDTQDLEACAYALSLYDRSLSCDPILNGRDAFKMKHLQDHESAIFRGHADYPGVSAPLAEELLQGMVACGHAASQGHTSKSSLKSSLDGHENVGGTDDGSATTGRCETMRLTFAHAETLGPLALLLLDESDPRLSTLAGIVPFGGNLALELWRLHDTPEPRLALRARLHEQTISLEGCPGSEFCDLDVVRTQLPVRAGGSGRQWWNGMCGNNQASR